MNLLIFLRSLMFTEWFWNFRNSHGSRLGGPLLTMETDFNCSFCHWMVGLVGLRARRKRMLSSMHLKSSSHCIITTKPCGRAIKCSKQSSDETFSWPWSGNLKTKIPEPSENRTWTQMILSIFVLGLVFPSAAFTLSLTYTATSFFKLCRALSVVEYWQ